jgi:hypothetical protein
MDQIRSFPAMMGAMTRMSCAVKVYNPYWNIRYDLLLRRYIYSIRQTGLLSIRYNSNKLIYGTLPEK